MSLKAALGGIERSGGMTSQKLQQILDDAVIAGAAPGLVAGVARLGEPDAIVAAGVRGLADPTPMDAASVFWIASCTKAITSAAALQLVERGRLHLDRPIAERLPALANLQVLDGAGADGAPRLRPAKSPVTLRHLLTHTSGFAYDFVSADLTRHFAATGGNLGSSLTSGMPLVFEPGSGWQYGIGIDVAAWLIEAETGQSLADHLAEHVLGPLGMADTGFVPDAVAARMVGMHQRTADGGLTPGEGLPVPPLLRGGGGLYSTVGDYLTFLRAVLSDDGAGVFGPQTLRWLREPQAHAGAAGEFVTAAPPLTADFRPLPGTPKSWTLGFLRNEADVPNGRRAGSLAWGGIFNCYYWADPQSGVAGALFGQLLPFADPQMLDVFEAVERAAYEP